MAERRSHYYIDGSTVKKIEYSSAEPARKNTPSRNNAVPARQNPEPARRTTKPQRRRQAVPQKSPNLSPRQKDRRWVDELKYGVFLTAVVICAVGLCFYVLKLNADVKEARNNVSNLEDALNEQLDANAEYSSGLDSMTDLDEIYKVATEELGMVYSEPGQTVYYSQNSDDYVVQYKNVPEAN